MNLMTMLSNIIRNGKESEMTETEFLEQELKSWLTSEKRNMMLVGKNYFDGNHDILHKQRQAVDACGNMRAINGLPNNQIVDNRYVELVEQKVNYLLAKPVEVKTKDENYGKKLDKIFNSIFRKRMKNLGVDILNCGIGYLHPYIKEDGTFAIKRFNPEEILPFWKDEEHEIIDSFVRIYPVSVYEGKQKKTIQKADYYTKQGIKHYVYENQNLVPDVEKQEEAYLNINEKPFTWSKIPLVAFKYNQREIPLIKRVKCLQDALNILLSNYSDNMMEDIRSTVLILEGYEGEELATFRKNLLAYGVVKVGTDERKGDVRALRIEVNAANYDLIIKLIKKAIIENGSGFDAKDDRMNNNPNQMNIRSIYLDIDLDANGMELEIQSSLEQLMFFVNTYLNITNNTQNENEVQFIFSRDTPINEAEVIENCRNSIGIISKETIISNHPWTKDTQDEIEKLKKETDEQMEDYVSNTLKEKKDE